MSTFDQRLKASARRGSSIGIHDNPLDDEEGAGISSFKIENIAHAKLITEEECNKLIRSLKSAM